MKVSEKKASELTKLSRATIQRFRDIPKVKLLNPIEEEKDGLYGKVTYYYYDEEEMEKLWLIRLFKSLGKTKNEIVEEMTNPNFNKRVFLETTINELNELIVVAKNYLNTEIGYEVLSINNNAEVFDFYDINEIINATSQIMNEVITSFMKNEKYHDTIDPDLILINFYENIYIFIEDNILPYDKSVQECIDCFIDDYFDNKYYIESFLDLILYTVKKMSDNNPKYVEMHYFLTKAFAKYEKNKSIKESIVILDNDKTWRRLLSLANENKEIDSYEVQSEIEKYILNMYYLYMKSWPLTLDSILELAKWLTESNSLFKYNKNTLNYISKALILFVERKKEVLNNRKENVCNKSKKKETSLSHLEVS